MLHSSFHVLGFSDLPCCGRTKNVCLTPGLVKPAVFDGIPSCTQYSHYCMHLTKSQYPLSLVLIPGHLKPLGSFIQGHIQDDDCLPVRSRDHAVDLLCLLKDCYQCLPFMDRCSYQRQGTNFRQRVFSEDRIELWAVHVGVLHNLTLAPCGGAGCSGSCIPGDPLRTRTAAAAECCAPHRSLVINVWVDIHDVEVPWNQIIIWWDDIHSLDILRNILLLLSSVETSMAWTSATSVERMHALEDRQTESCVE